MVRHCGEVEGTRETCGPSGFPREDRSDVDPLTPRKSVGVRMRGSSAEDVGVHRQRRVNVKVAEVDVASCAVIGTG